jgi:hypothetical protein
MFTDIVFPHGNEKEIVEMARVLGIGRLLMLYEGKPKILPDLGMAVVTGSVRTADGKSGIAVFSSEKDRLVFERSDAPKVLLGLGESGRHDKMHQRESGLNQPLLRDLAHREAVVVLSLASLLRREGAERSELMGRWMQNISLCRKMKVPIVIASCAASPYDMRSPHDMQSVGIVLGMHPSEAAAALVREF